MTISKHTIRASIEGVADINVIDAEATLDESWSPYAQARLTCAIPPLDSLTNIDPRNNQRLRIRLEQRFGESQPLSALSAAWALLVTNEWYTEGPAGFFTFPSGLVEDPPGSGLYDIPAYLVETFAGSGVYTIPDAYTIVTLADQTTALAGTFLSGLSATYGQPYNAFGTRPSTRRYLDLVLRSRSVNFNDGTMTLGAASDEAVLQDYALVATAALAPGSTSVRAVCAWVLGRLGIVLDSGTADGTVEASGAEWQPGQTAWDYLRPIVDKAGLRLWCDEHRNWHLANPADGSTGGLTISADRATKAEDTITRDEGWSDAVVIKYQWRDAAGSDQTAYDTATLPGYSKVRAITLDRPYPGAGAAQAILSRATGRGRVQALEAVSDYGATPGMAFTATLPDTPIQTGLLSAVTWRVPDDEMRISTRDLIETPDTAWVFTPVGVAWNEIAVGIDWTEYDV